MGRCSTQSSGGLQARQQAVRQRFGLRVGQARALAARLRERLCAECGLGGVSRQTRKPQFVRLARVVVLRVPAVDETQQQRRIGSSPLLRSEQGHRIE